MPETPTQSSPRSHSNIDETPIGLRMSALLISLLVLGSTIPWIWMSIGKFGGFAWGLFGFELMVFLGALMSIFVVFKKIHVGSAWALAIICVAGTLLVDMVFGLHVDARAVVGDNASVTPWINRTILFRAGSIGALSILATLDVYRRDPRSWGLFLRAMIFLIPVLGTFAWIRFKGMPFTGQSTGEPSAMNMVLLLLAGLFLGILFSIGGHFFIRSYEIVGSDDSNES